MISIRQMSLSNFRNYCKTFSDDIPDDFIMEASPTNFTSYKANNAILEYQDIPTLLQCAALCPPKPHFKTKVGLICFIIQALDVNPSLFEQMRPIFQNRWAGDERRTYIGNLIEIPQILRGAGIEEILCVPPNRFEQPYCILRNSGMDVDQILDYFNKKYKLMVTSLRQLAQRQYVIVDKTVTGDQLMNIVRRNLKELRTIPDQVIYQLTMIEPAINPRITRGKILEADKVTFRIQKKGDPYICENSENSYLENVRDVDYYISYGTLINRRCYTIEELKGSFYRQDEKRYVFSHPENPNQVFTEAEINELILLTWHSDIPEMHQFAIWLSRAMEAFREYAKIENLSEQDRPVFIEILLNVFEAGMYQRTWQGPGYPYPMKTEQTRQECDIPVLMTPSLNNIYDLVQGLSPDGKMIWGHLSVADRYGPSSQRLAPIIEDIRKAEYCIAMAQYFLIGSGYYYLTKLGVTIPGFDIDQFETMSTNREQIL